MEHSVWAAAAMLYGLVPLSVFGGILYYAHYHAKMARNRLLLYCLGGVGCLLSLGWLIYATTALS